MKASDHLLRTFAAVPPSTRVLDAGCGDGRHLVPLIQLGFEVHGCDTSEAAIGAARDRLQSETEQEGGDLLTVQDAAHLSFEDDFFGWVVACELLDAYSDAERLALLADLRRVLEPGGWIYLTWNGAPEALTDLLDRVGFAVAEAPTADADEEAVRGIFRRYEAGIIG